MKHFIDDLVEHSVVLQDASELVVCQSEANHFKSEIKIVLNLNQLEVKLGIFHALDSYYSNCKNGNNEQRQRHYTYCNACGRLIHKAAQKCNKEADV